MYWICLLYTSRNHERRSHRALGHPLLGDAQRGLLGRELDAGHARRACEADALRRAQRAPEHRAEVAVADRKAEGLLPECGRLEPGKAEMPGIGDVNRADLAGARAVSYTHLGIGDTIRVSLTPEPGGDRSREVIVAQELLQTMSLRSFTPLVTACPGCGRTTSTYFQTLAERIQAHLRQRMPQWRDSYVLSLIHI